MIFLLLGSGELGREFTIEAIRHGHKVIACDSYENAPAMLVATKSLVFDMLDGDKLRQVVETHKPDFIIPEIEAIATDEIVLLEQEGWKVIPCANAVKATMNRDVIRDIAFNLGIRTPRFYYANSFKEFGNVEHSLNMSKKCVIKPVMSSSGKGQSIVGTKDNSELQLAWNYAIENMRGNKQRVIIEEFINFEAEYTLLSILEKDGNIKFCDPIAHYQENGDYRWSSQNPSEVNLFDSSISSMKEMASKVIKELTKGKEASGVFGVEFFVMRNRKDNTQEVIFSELSPRPHDTGLVTLRSQSSSEFKLHLKAILGLKIFDSEIKSIGGVSATLNASTKDQNWKLDINQIPDIDCDVICFNKPTTRFGRRMGVILANNLEDAIKVRNRIDV